MFDRQAQPHAELLDQIGHQFHKHVSAMVTLDCSAVGWVPGGSGSESGRFDYEGNGLLIVPTWMRANDLQISAPSSLSGHAQGASAAKIYVFANTKDNPGLPFQIHSESFFGSFAGMCCSFKRFYVYCSKPPAFGQSSVIQLAVLKGLDLTGVGATHALAVSAAEIIGCYGA